MKISIQCAQCGKQYQVKPELAGKKVKCQACGASVPVPADSGSPEATPPKKAASAATKTRPATARPPASKQPTAGKTPEAASAAPPPQHSILDEALAGAARLPAAGEMYCPKCKAIISASSVLCIQCGFDLAAGRDTRVSSEANRPKRKPGQMPGFGYVVGILAILYGLPNAVLNGIQMVQCIMILVDRGLPDGTDPVAAIGMFGFPVAMLLFLASMLMFSTGIGILRKVKGATPNAVLASKIFVGFGVFAIVVISSVYIVNSQREAPAEPPPGQKKTVTVREYVTQDLMMKTILYCGLGMVIPVVIWGWGATQGRRWDWELPEPVHKLKLKPVAKVGGPSSAPETKK